MLLPGRENLPDSGTFCTNKQEKRKESEKFTPKKIYSR